MTIRVRNWRDQAPYVAHISALVWTLYQSHDQDETSPPDVNRLHGINSFVKHGLQGHQHSDHHQHDNIEQMYFILRGRGQLLIGDDKVDVRDGTAVYMPVNVPHQAFNEGEGWMEHLIVSCPLDEIREGTPAVRDWRDVHPEVLEGGTVSWPLLRRETEAPTGEGGVLQRVHSVTRYAVQGRGETAWQQLDGIELVHYVLGGYGSIEDAQGNRQVVTEGSAAHVLPGESHRFSNQSEGWLEYVTFAVEVGEIEAPAETDEDADSEESAAPIGVQEAVTAAVMGEIDWDQAAAVETEEEIEEEADADEAEDEAEEAEAEAADADDVVDEAEAAVAAVDEEDEAEEADDVEEAVVAAVDEEDETEEADDVEEEAAVAAVDEEDETEEALEEDGVDLEEDDEESAAVDEIDEESAAVDEIDEEVEEVEDLAEEEAEDTWEDPEDADDAAEDEGDAGDEEGDPGEQESDSEEGLSDEDEVAGDGEAAGEDDEDGGEDDAEDGFDVSDADDDGDEADEWDEADDADDADDADEWDEADEADDGDEADETVDDDFDEAAVEDDDGDDDAVAEDGEDGTSSAEEDDGAGDSSGDEDDFDLEDDDEEFDIEDGDSPDAGRR